MGCGSSCLVRDLTEEQMVLVAEVHPDFSPDFVRFWHKQFNNIYCCRHLNRNELHQFYSHFFSRSSYVTGIVNRILEDCSENASELKFPGFVKALGFALRRNEMLDYQDEDGVWFSALDMKLSGYIDLAHVDLMMQGLIRVKYFMPHMAYCCSDTDIPEYAGGLDWVYSMFTDCSKQQDESINLNEFILYCKRAKEMYHKSRRRKMYKLMHESFDLLVPALLAIGHAFANVIKEERSESTEKISSPADNSGQSDSRNQEGAGDVANGN